MEVARSEHGGDDGDKGHVLGDHLGDAINERDLQWQWLQPPWQDMSQKMHDAMVAHMNRDPTSLTGEHEFQHDYISKFGKPKTTMYKVDFDKLYQYNPDSGKERRIRLVARVTMRGGVDNQEVSDLSEEVSIRGDVGGVHQEGGSTGSHAEAQWETSWATSSWGNGRYWAEGWTEGRPWQNTSFQ